MQIIDTGQGISESTLEEIVDACSKGDKETMHIYLDNGLGLFLAQKTAKGLGGEIKVITTGENKGCVFELRLPLDVDKALIL